MINIGISLLAAILVFIIFTIGLQVSAFLSVPMGILLGFALFIVLGRKIQSKLQNILEQMQREVQDGKPERAIETLKSGLAFEKRHIFVGGQLRSQIGVLYYIQKKHDLALEYLKKGFVKHFLGQGMMAVIYYKRKDYATMKKVMDATVQANKKESIVYALYAYLLYQLKEKEAAIEILQKGLKKLPDDQRLQSNLALLQNNKRMKMKVYGELWVQFMLERAPRLQQAAPPHMRMSRKAMFR